MDDHHHRHHNDSGGTGGEKQQQGSAFVDLEAGTYSLPARPRQAALSSSGSRGDNGTTTTTETLLPPGSATATATVAAASATLDAAESAARTRPIFVDPGDAVLSLRNCRHTFHKRCLASWCLRWRYDCPVCREPYHHGDSEPVGVVSYI